MTAAQLAKFIHAHEELDILLGRVSRTTPATAEDLARNLRAIVAGWDETGGDRSSMRRMFVALNELQRGVAALQDETITIGPSR